MMKRVFVFALCLFAPVWAMADFDEFQRAHQPRDWSFPRDHGSHPEYGTEWWYFTGSLQDLDGRRLGYELTFFRVALRPDTVQPATTAASSWRARDLILAHMAVTEVHWDNFFMHERVQRAAAGLAGADTTTLNVWAGDWGARMDGSDVLLSASSNDVRIELTLTPTRGPILHGENGLSFKDAQGDQASHYYSMPRMVTEGSLWIEDKHVPVTGTTWMDHEFFTGSTPVEGLGWDWFSCRLEDGRDLMLYVVRHPDRDDYRFGTLVDTAGRSHPLNLTGMTATPTESWKSPTTNTVYPVAWNLQLPEEDAVIEVRALLPQQEIVATSTVGFAYWEGLSEYSGTFGGEMIRGDGYVELTGY